MSAATARQLLTEGGYTCVFCKDGTVHTSTERGVKPLVAFYRANTPLKGFAQVPEILLGRILPRSLMNFLSFAESL